MKKNKNKNKKIEIKDWRLISLLNVDSKIISKVLLEKSKYVLPDLISSQQTAFVKNRYIGESGKLISDVIEITIIENIEVF